MTLEKGPTVNLEKTDTEVVKIASSITDPEIQAKVLELQPGDIPGTVTIDEAEWEKIRRNHIMDITNGADD